VGTGAKCMVPARDVLVDVAGSYSVFHVEVLARACGVQSPQHKMP